MQVVPPAKCVPAARRAATLASSGRSPGRDQAGAFLPKLDRFVIALTIITAMSVVVGTRAAMPSYSYDLVPAAVAAPTR